MLPPLKSKPAESLSETMHKLKQMAEQREKEKEVASSREEEKMRHEHENTLIDEINHHVKHEADDSEDEEGANAQTNVELDEDSGLRNYFKEIVENANRFGEKIDLSQYKHLVKEYDS